MSCWNLPVFLSGSLCFPPVYLFNYVNPLIKFSLQRSLSLDYTAKKIQDFFGESGNK